MYLSLLKEKIENLQVGLPGFEAQKLLSPPYRQHYDMEEIKKAGPRIAAVMILLYENEEGQLEFPVILRHSYQGVHSNQYALPGGSFEPEDINLQYTALRETVEELGLEEDRIEIIGQLTELYIPPSNFLVYPYIGVFHGTPEFYPDEMEVSAIIPIDLEAFLNAEPIRFEKSFSGQVVEIPAYRIEEGEYIWGATAMILSEFNSLLEKL